MRTDGSLLDRRAILLNYCNNSYVLVATELNQSIREHAAISMWMCRCLHPTT